MLSDTYALTPQDGLCLMCRSRLVSDPRSEETVCSGCGIVYEDQKMYSPFDGFDPQPSTTFSGRQTELGSVMEYDLDLPTLIGRENFDVRGKNLESSEDLDRLRKLNNYTLGRDANRKSLTQAIDSIRRITEKLNAGNAVAERAFQIYRKLNDDPYARRKAITRSALASVYAACKELSIARSSKEIETAIREMNPKGVHHFYNSIKDQLQVEDNTPGPSSFVSRIAKRAGLSGKTERKSIEILQKVQDSKLLIGKRPVPIAAAALHIASSSCGEYVPVSKIACSADVTPITVRRRIQEISESMHTSPIPNEPSPSSPGPNIWSS